MMPRRQFLSTPVEVTLPSGDDVLVRPPTLADAFDMEDLTGFDKVLAMIECCVVDADGARIFEDAAHVTAALDTTGFARLIAALNSFNVDVDSPLSERPADSLSGAD